MGVIEDTVIGVSMFDKAQKMAIYFFGYLLNVKAMVITMTAILIILCTLLIWCKGFKCIKRLVPIPNQERTPLLMLDENDAL